MGEYINLDGKPYKLGTCEDLYYVRMDQLRQWIDAGRTEQLSGNLPPREYLKPEHGFRFRFPFPGEEAPERVPGSDDYDHGLRVCIPKDCDFDLVEHDHVTAHFSAGKYGGYQVNAMLPCPQSKEWLTATFKKSVSGGWEGRTSVIEIVQQKYVEAEIWTVIRCPHCGQKVRLDSTEGLRLARIIRDEERDSAHAREFWDEVARRIEDGYVPDRYGLVTETT